MTEFFRLSGGGNDFLALAAPPAEPSTEQIRRWCRRGISLGADGLFLLRPVETGSVSMQYFNADGHRAELCINGTRCAARLAFFLGWASAEVEIVTDSGRLQAEEVDSCTVKLEAPLPPERPERLSIDSGVGVEEGWRLVVGVPHFVVPVAGSLEEVAVASRGAALRRHPHFAPAGTNVDFVSFGSLPDPAAHLALRTFERGVEAETLACGTGVLAAAACGVASKACRLPVEARTHGGFTFVVEGTVENDRPVDWWMTGDARLIARGEIFDQAAIAPAAVC